jgi:hypothetical protein
MLRYENDLTQLFRICLVLNQKTDLRTCWSLSVMARTALRQHANVFAQSETSPLIQLSNDLTVTPEVTFRLMKSQTS